MVEINASAQYQTQAENDKSERQILRKNLSVPESMIHYHFLPKQILILPEQTLLFQPLKILASLVDYPRYRPVK